MNPLLLPFIAAATTTSLSGVVVVATRYLVQYVDPVPLGLLRFGIGFAILFVVFRGWQRRHWLRPRDAAPVIALGLIQFAGFAVLYNAAEPFARRAPGLSRNEFGPDHPHTGAFLNNLAELYGSQGRYGDVEPLQKRSLAIRETALRPDHPSVGQSLNNLALLYVAHGHYDAAEPLYKRSLSIKDKVLGPEHPSVGTSLENYAALLRETGRGAEADKMEARAKAIRAKQGKVNP